MIASNVFSVSFTETKLEVIIFRVSSGDLK